MGNKSSFQLAVERLEQFIPLENIFISTNVKYVDTLQSQAPNIPTSNYILEPSRRDLAAAVALAFNTLLDKGIEGNIIFQWGDSYVQNVSALNKAFATADFILENNPDRIVFVGEKPRFPNENLGWIEMGDRLGDFNGEAFYSYKSWKYRPQLDECIDMFNSGNYVWNSGYFVSTVQFVVSEFRRRAPEITTVIDKIFSYKGQEREQALTQLYPSIPAIHFDNAFLERIDTDQAVLIPADLQWADPGSLYALKEALQSSANDNVTVGKVVSQDTYDSLLFNEESGKVLAVMGLEGVIVVNTADAILVISKNAVRYIAMLLDKLEKSGYSNLL
jgi:mannose-1-phosphate guanylyltransferase